MDCEKPVPSSPFDIMASKLESVIKLLEDAASYSAESLYRPEMSFSELREHFSCLAGLYRQQLVRKALLTHRTFSVKKLARRKVQPLTEARRQQLIAAGRKGGSKIGSLKKAAAAKVNAGKAWRKIVGAPTRRRRPQKSS